MSSTREADTFLTVEIGHVIVFTLMLFSLFACNAPPSISGRLRNCLFRVHRHRALLPFPVQQDLCCPIVPSLSRPDPVTFYLSPMVGCSCHFLSFFRPQCLFFLTSLLSCSPFFVPLSMLLTTFISSSATRRPVVSAPSLISRSLLFTPFSTCEYNIPLP